MNEIPFMLLFKSLPSFIHKKPSLNKLYTHLRVMIFLFLVSTKPPLFCQNVIAAFKMNA